MFVNLYFLQPQHLYICYHFDSNTTSCIYFISDTQYIVFMLSGEKLLRGA